MASLKYKKAPGPFPEVNPSTAANYKFDAEKAEMLRRELPEAFRDLTVPADLNIPALPPNASIADLLVRMTQERIGIYFSVVPAMRHGEPLTPASERAAIRRLRYALKPFIKGYVSEPTADLIPSDLDNMLRKRDEELRLTTSRPTRQPPLQELCGHIGVFLTSFATANNVSLTQAQVLRFVSLALDLAEIEHPSPESHSGGLRDLVFPPEG